LNFNSSRILKQKTSLKLPTSLGELQQFKRHPIYNFYLVAKPKRYKKHKKTHPCHMAYRAKLNSLQLDHMMHKTNFKKIIFFRPQLVCTKNKLKLILVISKFDSITTTNQHNINYQQPCDNLLYVKLTQKEKKPMLKQSKFKCNTTQLKY